MSNYGNAFVSPDSKQYPGSVVPVWLEVKERNTRAMDFYKRNGFVPVEYLESFYNDGSSGVRMVCDLGAGYRT